MKNYWFLISLVVGFLSGVLTYILVGNCTFSIVSSLLVFILTLVFLIIFDPKRFYMRAFWSILSLGFGVNQLFFEVTGKLFDIDFTVKNNSANDWTVIILGLLAALCLLFKYLERNTKGKISFFNINKNKVGRISGDGNHIHQKINTSKDGDD